MNSLQRINYLNKCVRIRMYVHVYVYMSVYIKDNNTHNKQGSYSRVGLQCSVIKESLLSSSLRHMHKEPVGGWSSSLNGSDKALSVD